ncbi:MAG: exodeoxyribonuclease VII large subunit [Pigmentiphaga sp.]|nr:exodeoxyribonuclease VII large subunit [Pigmentiphaga sp.]
MALTPGSSAPAGLEPEQVLEVSQLNRRVAEVLEHSFPLFWVRGEVSNFLAAASGHWYFSLKDAGAAVKAVMFRGRASQVGFLPRVGDRIEVRARVSLYEPRGDFQLQVQGMRRAGQGSLFEAFLRLKEQLAREGLLAVERKRQPPVRPRSIGVITSLRAAALRDVITCLARRVPHVPVVVYPSAVQGAEAPAQLLAALRRANTRAEVDVLLLVRGGGSIEDLWAFNDEALARAIAASGIPVICGVGHESDFTIADLVADVRAPTPTAAAELACVARAESWQQVHSLAQALARAQLRRLERLAQRVDRAALRLVSPGERLARQRERLQRLEARLRQAQERRFERWRQRLQSIDLARRSPARLVAARRHHLEQLATRLQQAMQRAARERGRAVAHADARLRALGPQQTLARGYAIARDAEGRVVRAASGLAKGQALRLDFASGAATVSVRDTLSEP